MSLLLHCDDPRFLNLLSINYHGSLTDLPPVKRFSFSSQLYQSDMTTLHSVPIIDWNFSTGRPSQHPLNNNFSANEIQTNLFDLLTKSVSKYS